LGFFDEIVNQILHISLKSAYLPRERLPFFFFSLQKNTAGIQYSRIPAVTDRFIEIVSKITEFLASTFIGHRLELQDEQLGCSGIKDTT